MATAVSICSNALMRLGSDPINSFDEADVTGSNIERARLASNLWPTVRRQVLRAHPWNVAIKRVLLSPDAVKPAFGYANRFQRPADWLRTIAVGEREHDRVEFRTEGNYFLCDDEGFYLVYVFDNDNPATYDASMVGALELAMAAALAYPVTKSTSLAEALSGELRAALSLARATDAQDDPPETLGDFPLLQSRLGRRWVM
jgi:hypothetical protein